MSASDPASPDTFPPHAMTYPPADDGRDSFHWSDLEDTRPALDTHEPVEPWKVGLAIFGAFFLMPALLYEGCAPKESPRKDAHLEAFDADGWIEWR